ncbi:ankyrin repeat domain-containing protein [bacterium]|nr:ankyrin repeat domain-containing protein [bacterium]
MRACMRAAGGGQLEVLKWLRENGCPIVKDMCTCAAQTGNIEMLQ